MEVHLHCIQYANNQPQKQLEEVCHSVFYYKRKKKIPINFFGKPYIVASRIIPELIENLNKDNCPVLIEGIHCSGIIPHINPACRKIHIRLCNVEYIYYQHLADTTTSLLRRLYYKSESIRLRKWEQQLVSKQRQFNALSSLDVDIYKHILKCKHVTYIPLFIPSWHLPHLSPTGTYCLYHGNLDIDENQKAVEWLIDEVFPNLSVPLYVAGKSDGSFIKKMRAKTLNAHWIENPSEKEMNDIIVHAQLHLLPSFNATGVKIKLLNALFNGRHCLVNNAAVNGSGLESVCIVANTAQEFKESIQVYSQMPFSNSEQEKRKKLLNTIYDNNKNAILLKQQLFGE